MLQVRVLYFAMLRDHKQVDQERVDVVEGTTVAQLYAQLFPPGPLGAIPVAYARNAVAVDAETLVCDGDEVVFIPPVGGG